MLLLHGYGDTGQMWSALARVLARTHTVIVPDLPGLGNSRPENPTAQYDMASVARSIHSLMQQLKLHRRALTRRTQCCNDAAQLALSFPSF